MYQGTVGPLLAALALSATAASAAQAQNWYRGNTHTHTITSSGAGAEIAVRWYREHGYQFLVITDHDYFNDVEPLNKSYGADGRFLVLPGQEVTQELRESAHPDGERSAHVNALNSSRLVKGISGYPRNFAHPAIPQVTITIPVAPEGATTMAKSYLRNVAEIRAAGGLPQINHPNWHWSVRPSDLFDVTGPALLEIWNGIPGSNNLGGINEAGERTPSAEELWDVLLSRGQIIWGVGSDDSHDFVHLDDAGAERPGQAWIVVRAERLAPETIMSALERGEFYASNGITLQDYTANTREIAIKLKRGGGPTITDTRFMTRFIGSNGRVLAEISGAAPRYTIKGDEGYVRASITDSNGKRAWTQPLFLKGCSTPGRSCREVPQASVTTVTAAELASWKGRLREAGATKQELAKFEAPLHGLVSSYFSGRVETLRATPPTSLKTYFKRYLEGERFIARERARERVPRSLFSDVVPVRSCESLRALSLPNTTIEAATIDETDRACHVTASVRHPPANDRVQVFVALPMKDWNGRFQGTGGGGFLGGSWDMLKLPIEKGYAAGATDTGHEGASGSFALDASGRLDWQRIRNNAYLGIHDMTVVGKALTQAFYGKPPKYSYFVGRSTGGRQGLMEAQRYPDDYDGVLSGCPAINLDRVFPAMLWPQDVMLQTKNFVSKDKLEAATAAAVRACDGADGVIDGVIGDPMKCTYQPDDLVGRRVGETEFTTTDSEVIGKIWEGPRSLDGRFLWHGIARGADLSAVAATTGTPLKGKPSDISLEWFQYFLAHDRHWDWTTLAPGEYELLFNQSVEQYRAAIGTDDPDQTEFRDRGGKLIMYHGLADEIIPAAGSVDYYRRVQEKMGGADRTKQLARLFLIPGVDHRFLGAGPSPTGLMNAIVDWVEEGKAPDRILAESSDENGKPLRTRPVFPYPEVARYKGKGSTDLADSFVGSDQ